MTTGPERRLRAVPARRPAAPAVRPSVPQQDIGAALAQPRHLQYAPALSSPAPATTASAVGGSSSSPRQNSRIWSAEASSTLG